MEQQIAKKNQDKFKRQVIYKEKNPKAQKTFEVFETQESKKAMQYRFLPNRLAKQKSDNTTSCQRCGEMGRLIIAMGV